MIKNKMNKTFFAQTISALFASVFLSSIAQAAPAGLTYQGRLVKNNLPVEANPVTLTVKVTSPGVNECILYEETHTLNMTNSDGIFSVKIGSGTRTVNDEALSMVQVFSNTGTVMPGLICGGGATTYTSVSADSRNIYATFNDGVDTVAFSSPYVIQSVPYALEAERLAGKSASEFLQTTADTTQSKINAITAASPYAELLALIGGTSTQYMTSSSAISTSGNITQTGTGTVTTGTGAVALNGPTTIGANQNFSMASGTGTFAQTYTGTGTASALTANSVTTSAAQSITGNGLTSGSLLSLSSNSTAAANGNKGLDIAISGANGSASVTRTGVSSVVTSTGATSTNVGGYFSATGATNNYGLIVANGNVGIGTASPTAGLEIVGGLKLQSGSSGGLLFPAFSAATQGIYSNTSSNDIWIGPFYDAIFAPANSSGRLRPSNDNTSGLGTPGQRWANLWVGTGDASFAGNVGIGTTSPVNQLSISSGGTGNFSGLSVTNTSPTQYANAAWFNDVGDQAQMSLTGSTFSNGIFGSRSFGISTGGSGGMTFGAYHASGGIQFATGGLAASNVRTTITSGGNVGIGTTGPNYKLDVAGDINTSTCFRLSSGTTVGGTCTSDERLKEDVQDYTEGLSDL